MNVNRVNYLFSEKEFDHTRDLYRAVLTAACKEASRKASLYTYYRKSLTDYSCSFDLDALLEHMPQVESATGRFKPKFSICDILETLRFLYDAGYLCVDKEFREIQLETHLFKMIAEAWAESMGVKNWRPSFPTDRPIYVASAKRCNQVEDARFSLAIRATARKEGVAA